MKINTFGIDTRTSDAKHLIATLRRLKTTTSATNGGIYCQDRSHCQVHVETSKTEKELEDWLYATKGIDYVGIFAMPAN